MNRTNLLPAILSLVGAFAMADTIVPISTTHNCSGGGTKTTTGTYDSTSGALSVNVAIANCVDTLGRTDNGTVAITGTATPPAPGGTAWNLNLSYAFNDAWASSTESAQRNCTITKSGTYDIASTTFTGTENKSSCSVSITETLKIGILGELAKTTDTSN